MPANTATLATPRIGPGDRLGLMLFFAAALHAIVILGITFVSSKHKNVPLPLTMEVILVQGPAAMLQLIADKMITNRGVISGKLQLTTTLIPQLHLPHERRKNAG